MQTMLAALGLALWLVTPALAAGTAEVGDLTIRDAWARASIGNAPNSVAYMTIETGADETDRLVGGSSPIARKVEPHSHVMDDGVARMRPVDAIEVVPGAPVVLEPGGLHLMMFGLKERLEEGATVPLSLTFERAGKVEFEVPVRGPSYGSEHGGHGQTSHGKSH